MYVEPGAEAPPHGSLPSTVPILGTKELLGIWRRKLHVPDGGSCWEQCEEHTCMDASFQDYSKFCIRFPPDAGRAVFTRPRKTLRSVKHGKCCHAVQLSCGAWIAMYKTFVECGGWIAIRLHVNVVAGWLQSFQVVAG